ncbi:MAG: antibiotic biosynthesis monooxygenase [Brevundimonas sp.]|nr:MAG: antibiotic biosynthesis monooxygenase [Brevundimonas sp.]
MLDPEVKRPGCCSYVVALDPAEEHAVWVTEAWVSQDAHAAALTPDARERLRPALDLIAVFGETTYTRPIGGIGL